MSGSAYAAKGPTTGPSTQTVWFGAVPDRLNLISPIPTSLTQSKSQNGIPANFGNQWTVGGSNNSSQGAFTTAPDGTTNVAQLLVESTANGVHQSSAGLITNFQGPGTYKLRIAAYCKSSNRRVGLQYQFTSGAQPINAVFDLVGGQVGVNPTVPTGQGSTYNSIFSLLSAAIKPAGNGWYLCTLDLTHQMGNESAPQVNIFIDNGTGTGALSNSYTGDGSSGVFVWRTNMMPVSAYTINNTVLFDDFTSLSTIDVNNTLAPGFNWYVNGVFGNFYNQGFTFNPNWLTQSGSHIRVQVTNPNQGGGASPALFGAAQTNASTGAFVGTNLWSRTRPMLLESRHLWEATVATVHVDTSWWGWNFEYINSQGTTKPAVVGGEWDFTEITSGLTMIPQANVGSYYGAVPNNVNIFDNPGGTSLNGTALYGPIGQATTVNPGFGSVYSNGSDGLAYAANGAVPLNTPPPNATFWTSSSSVLLLPAVDITQFHTWSVLWNPYFGNPLGPNSTDACGNMFLFCDGLMCNSVHAWAPNFYNFNFGATVTISCATDNQHFMPIYFFDNSGTTTGVPMQIDFFRAMQ